MISQKKAMRKQYLVVDVSNLAYRALYTTGGLSHEGEATGVLYGIFKTVWDLQELFNATHILFCFDGGYDKRQEILPEYKKKRRTELDEEQKAIRRDLRRQLYRLRTRYLAEAGFKNIFWQEGYEADDIIASVVLSSTEETVIVSSDHDLFQLLSPHVIIWNPVKKKSVTDKSFTDQWGIGPMAWVDVKALAGCTTDNVPGIHGIGEKTAANFVSGRLKPGKKYEAIVAGNDIWERNRRLVQLPMEGTETFEVQDDEVTRVKWNKMVGSLGMKSLKKGRMQ
jgi:DNA polymerase-1